MELLFNLIPKYFYIRKLNVSYFKQIFECITLKEKSIIYDRASIVTNQTFVFKIDSAVFLKMFCKRWYCFLITL